MKLRFDFTSDLYRAQVFHNALSLRGLYPQFKYTDGNLEVWIDGGDSHTTQAIENLYQFVLKHNDRKSTAEFRYDELYAIFVRTKSILKRRHLQNLMADLSITILTQKRAAA